MSPRGIQSRPNAGVVWIVGATGITTVSAFVSSVATARGLPPTDRGLFLQIFAACSFLGYVGGLGLSTPIVSLSRGSGRAAAHYIETSRFAVGIGACLAIILGSLFTRILAGASTWALALSVLSGALVGSNVLTQRQVVAFRVAQDFRVIGTAAVIPVVVPMGAFLAMSALKALSIGTALGALVVGNLVLAVVLTKLRGEWFEKAPAVNRPTLDVGSRVLLGLGVKELMSALPVLIMATLDVVVIGQLTGAWTASIYAVSKSMASPVLVVGAVVINYIPARMAAIPRPAQAKLFRTGLLAAVSSASILGIVSLLLSTSLLDRVFGHEYAASLTSGAALILAAVAVTASAVASSVLRVALDYRFMNSVSYLICAAVVAIGALSLHSNGILGFAITVLGLRALESVLLVGRVKRLQGADLPDGSTTEGNALVRSASSSHASGEGHA